MVLVLLGLAWLLRHLLRRRSGKLSLAGSSDAGRLSADADLLKVRAAAEETLAELHQMIGRDDLHTRVHLRVARASAQAPRVE